MKTAQDPRHQHRILQMQQLFSYSFRNNEDNKKITDIVPHLSDIDTQIAASAPEWPVDKIAKIDLAILRLAIYELTHVKDIPQKVVIDEAVELAKAFGNTNSPKFINGVLGTIIQKI
jgi:N utilization substance protein B